MTCVILSHMMHYASADKELSAMEVIDNETVMSRMKPGDHMSDSPSISASIFKYILQWAMVFAVLYWWLSDKPSWQWVWIPAIGVCTLGLVLMAAVKIIGGKATDALSAKLKEDLAKEVKEDSDF